MIDATILRELVVRPTLKRLQLHTPAAEELVMGTAAQESHLKYVRQLGGGPALGLFQMEPATYKDIYANYLRYRTDIARLLEKFGGRKPEDMVGNPFYACAMCRIHYRRFPELLPEPNDIRGMGELWKFRYNSPLGAGTVEEFILNYERVRQA